MFLLKLNEINSLEWNNFVFGSTNGSIFNTIEWLSVFGTSLRNATPFLLIHKNKELIAGLPFIEIRKYGLKNYYSMPYGGYGGVIRDSKLIGSGNLDSARLLLREFNKLTTGRWGMLSISDFYGGLSETELIKLGFKKYKHTTHILPVDSALEQLWEKLPSTKKSAIRKAEKSNVRIYELQTKDEVKVCYKMFGDTARRHGKKVPEFSLKFYTEILQRMKPFLRWIVADKGGFPIACAINFAYKDSIFYLDGGSFSSGLQYRPNDALMWDTIVWGHKGGYKYYNLGSSPTSGLIKFKESWCAVSKHYSFYCKNSPLLKRGEYSRIFLKKVI